MMNKTVGNVACSMFVNGGSAITNRNLATTSVLCRVTAGKHKPTKFRTKPLTYEMAQKPEHIGIRKAWLDWHTQNLEGFRQRQQKTVAEDDIIRRLLRGTWPHIFVSEVVLKRRGNIIIIVGIIEQNLPARKIYWLIGYTEELLSLLLKQPVKMELQTVAKREEIVFKYI